MNPETLLSYFEYFQDIFLVFDKNKTQRLEYQEVAPALNAAGGTDDTHTHQ